MNIGVPGADHHAVVVVEHEVSVQDIRPGLDREIETDERGAMGYCRGRETPSRIQTDVVVQEVDRAGHEAREQQGPQEPVLERDENRQREEVEADVLSEQRIDLTIWRLVEEPEDEVPPAGLAHGDEKARQRRRLKSR